MCLKKIASLWRKVASKEEWLQPSEPSIGKMFWVMYVVGFGSYLASFGMNIKTLVSYSSGEQWWFFSILLMAIVLPQVPINLFSFWWYRTDSSSGSVSWGVTIMHCLLLAVPLRMTRMGVLASHTREGRAGDFHRFHLAQADLSFLRLVAVYAGSGSQLVVRIYKLLNTWDTAESVRSELVFGALSAVSLAMSTISLCRHSRTHRYDKQELSRASTMLQILYRICFLASRVVALACLYNLGIVPAVITCLCISVVCFIWFICMKTDFTENRPQELFFCFLMSYLHLFAMFNVKDNPARHRYAFYYSIGFFVEVLVFTTYIMRNNDMVIVSVFPCVFLVGLVCHSVEHHLFHPDGRWYMKRTPSEWESHCDECEAEQNEEMLKKAAVAAEAC